MIEKSAPRRSRSPRVRGFTMIELVIVVTIIGVLAAIAIYSVTKYIQYAKASEAAEIVGAIKAGQEAYYDETFQYLAVDSSNDPDHFYPDQPTTTTTRASKIQWGAANGSNCTGCGTRYRALGVLPAAPVLFRYSCVTGAAGATPGLSTFATPSPSPFSGAATQPFYVVNAVSDLDGNGSGYPMSAVVGSNLMGDLNSSNIGQ